VLSVVVAEVVAAVVLLVVWLDVPSNWLRMDCTSLVSCVSGSELLELLVLVELSLAAVVLAVLLLAELLPPDCSDTKAACKSLASFWNGFIPPEPACVPLEDDVFVLVESPVGGGPGGGPGGG
jgi:H+/Cl- antiporter ClcA